MGTKPGNEFENAAMNQSGGNIVSEFIEFLKYNKKWWLLPIVIMIILMGLLIIMSGSAAAPFIYTLF
jgi:hypothetical protein